MFRRLLSLVLSCTILCTMLCTVFCVLQPSSVQAKGRAAQAEPAEPATFLIRNQSHRDLVAIRISDGTTASFARLDLGPGGEDELENPGGTAEVRLDLGLVLNTWEGVQLNGLQSLTLCSSHENCLIVTGKDGKPVHRQGESKSLLPAKDADPVCSITGLKAGMTMQDACGLMQNYYTMEEDVYLATLGFANIAWSARLYANTEKGEDLENAVLENVELRQKLSPSNLKAVQEALDRLGYTAWQATFPGMELTFSDMTNYTLETRNEILHVCLNTFLRQGRGIGSIMFAPADLIDTLANEDLQSMNIQLFTLSLHRDSDTLILDISAYSTEDMAQ